MRDDPATLRIFTPPMQRTFLLNLLLLLALNLLVKPFYLLGIDAGVQDAVGASTYGTYAALLSLSFLLNIVLDLGITNYTTRHIAQHTHLMGKYLSGVAGVRIAFDRRRRPGTGLRRATTGDPRVVGAQPGAGGEHPLPAQQHQRCAAFPVG
jgi:hypothetical protein